MKTKRMTIMAIAIALTIGAVAEKSGAASVTNYPALKILGDMPEEGYQFGGSGAAQNGIVWSESFDYDGIGALYSFNAKTGVNTIIYDFPNIDDGNSPAGGLILYSNELFGVASDGGANESGTIFVYATNTATYTVIYSPNPATEGAGPLSAPITQDGINIYGNMEAGGPNDNNRGSFYSMDYSAGSWHKKWITLATPTDGINPYGRMCFAPNGSPYVYSTTSGGGAHTSGSIVRLAESSGTINDVHDFNGTTELNSILNGLYTMPGDTNNLYGIGGSSASSAIIYKVAADTGTFTQLYSANGYRASDLSQNGPENALYEVFYGSTGGMILRIDSGGNVVVMTNLPTNITNYTGALTSGLIYDRSNHDMYLPSNGFNPTYTRPVYSFNPVDPAPVLNETGETNGSLIGFYGVSGNTYIIQSSTNFLNWSDDVTITATNGFPTALDTNQIQAGHGFWRTAQYIPDAFTNEFKTSKLLGVPAFVTTGGISNFRSYFPPQPPFTGSTNSGSGGPPPPLVTPDGMSGSDSDSAEVLIEEMLEAIMPPEELHGTSH